MVPEVPGSTAHWLVRFRFVFLGLPAQAASKAWCHAAAGHFPVTMAIRKANRMEPASSLPWKQDAKQPNAANGRRSTRQNLPCHLVRHIDLVLRAVRALFTSGWRQQICPTRFVPLHIVRCQPSPAPRAFHISCRSRPGCVEDHGSLLDVFRECFCL